jgi:hypothetical protein
MQLELFASWGPRAEAPREIAERLMRFLDVLTRELPDLGPLYRSRDTPRQPLMPIGATVEALALQIESQVVRNDTDRRVMEGAGYFAMWDDNTRRLEQAGIDLEAGAITRANRLSLLLPSGGVPGFDTERALRLVEAAAAAFEPRFVDFAPNDCRPTRGHDGRRGPCLAWIAWWPAAEIRDRRVTTINMAGGTALLSTPAVFDGTSAEHRAAANALEDVARKHRLV